MSETISIDDALTCFGVAWNYSTSQAEKFFSDHGFQGVKNVEKQEVLNGNAARWAAKDAADKRGEGHTYWWLGNYDWGVTADSAVYRFDYTGFTGERTTEGDQRWAGYAELDEHSKRVHKDG